MTSGISPSTRRASDIKLLAVITSAVLAFGFLTAGTILFLSRGGATGQCGQRNAGSLPNLVQTASIAPSFVAFTGNCRYWLATRDGRLVAIQPTIPSRHCTVDWKPSTSQFTCNGQKVSYSQLAYYPTAVGTGAFAGSWIIDFGDETTPTT
jgi:hypothetical protein